MRAQDRRLSLLLHFTEPQDIPLSSVGTSTTRRLDHPSPCPARIPTTWLQTQALSTCTRGCDREQRLRNDSQSAVLTGEATIALDIRSVVNSMGRIPRSIQTDSLSQPSSLTFISTESVTSNALKAIHT